MWLHNYLKFRAELAESADQAPKSSFECLYKWSTFSGFRTSILEAASNFLKQVKEDYIEKFSNLPDNILTRTMMLFGLVIGPIAPIPMLMVDFSILMGMLSVFAAGWLAGGAVTVILAGLGWIVGGNNTAEYVYKTGTNVTEDIMFFVLNLLRLPAGALNLAGLAPSLVLETATEGLNYVCVSAAEGVYTCRLPKLSMPSKNAAPAATTSSQNIDLAPKEKLETNVTMLSSYSSNTKAKDTLGGEILSEVITSSLPTNKLIIT